MDSVRGLDLPTGEYTFRVADTLSNAQPVSALIGGGEVRLYDVVGPAGRKALEVTAVPGATPLADDMVGTVVRAADGESILTLEDRGWTRSYALYDAAEGDTVATMRKSWYAVGPVEVRDSTEAHRATVSRAGRLPALGAQPKPRHLTTPNNEPIAQLEHTKVADAPTSKPRLKWKPTVTIQSAGLPSVVVLAVCLAVSEDIRSEKEDSTGPTQ